jgi:dolichyl-phosphate-mannose--protein O-mannosyl transferase
VVGPANYKLKFAKFFFKSCSWLIGIYFHFGKPYFYYLLDLTFMSTSGSSKFKALRRIYLNANTLKPHHIDIYTADCGTIRMRCIINLLTEFVSSK